jgi:hypothetical protein
MDMQGLTTLNIKNLPSLMAEQVIHQTVLMKSVQRQQKQLLEYRLLLN